MTAGVDEQTLERLREQGDRPDPLFPVEDQLPLFALEPHPRRLLPWRPNPDTAITPSPSSTRRGSTCERQS